jgi:hypothetical protein
MYQYPTIDRAVADMTTRLGVDEAVRRLHKLAMLAQGETRSTLLTRARDLQCATR